MQPSCSPLPHQTTHRHDRKSDVCTLVNGSLTSHPPSLGTHTRSTHTQHTPMQTCTFLMAARSLPSTCWWWTPSTSASGLVRDIEVGRRIGRSLEQRMGIQVCCSLGVHHFLLTARTSRLNFTAEALAYTLLQLASLGQVVLVSRFVPRRGSTKP